MEHPKQGEPLHASGQYHAAHSQGQADAEPHRQRFVPRTASPGSLSSEVDPVFGTVKRDFDINPYSYALRSRARSTLMNSTHAITLVQHQGRVVQELYGLERERREIPG